MRSKYILGPVQTWGYIRYNQQKLMLKKRTHCKSTLAQKLDKLDCFYFEVIYFSLATNAINFNTLLLSRPSQNKHGGRGHFVTQILTLQRDVILLFAQFETWNHNNVALLCCVLTLSVLGLRLLYYSSLSWTPKWVSPFIQFKPNSQRQWLTFSPNATGAC